MVAYVIVEYLQPPRVIALVMFIVGRDVPNLEEA
jgi:hypothetical protein